MLLVVNNLVQIYSESMRDYTIPRNFKLANGVNVSVEFHPSQGAWWATITRDTGTLLPEIFNGSSTKSPLRAFKNARFQKKRHDDPTFNKVYERITPKYGESIVETMIKAKDKLLMNAKNEPPKTLIMNSKTAQVFRDQLSIYEDHAKLAALGMPVIIVDNSLPDRKVLHEKKK